MYELTRLTNRWLVSEPSGPGPVERVVMDRYLRALPYEGQKLACQSNPQSAEQLVTLVEGYLAAHAVLRPGRPGKAESTRRLRNPTPVLEPPRPPSRSFGEPRGSAAEPRRCFSCGEVGHLSWGCPHRQDVAMPTASSDSNPRKPCGLLTVCWGQTEGPSAVTPVRLNGRDASALLDSGSAVTLARPEYAPGPLLPGKLAVTCIHGETRQYPTASISMQTTKGVFQGMVGLVPELPVEVLIGRDAALFPALWRSLAGRDGERGQPRSRRPRHSPPLCGFQEGEPGDSTDPLSEGAASAAAERAEEESRATGPERRPLSPAEEGDDLLEMFPLGSDAPPLPARLTGRFGVAQLEDPNLASALSQVAVVDGQPVQGLAQHGAVIGGRCHVWDLVRLFLDTGLFTHVPAFSTICGNLGEEKRCHQTSIGKQLTVHTSFTINQIYCRFGRGGKRGKLRRRGGGVGPEGAQALDSSSGVERGVRCTGSGSQTVQGSAGGRDVRQAGVGTRAGSQTDQGSAGGRDVRQAGVGTRAGSQTVQGSIGQRGSPGEKAVKSSLSAPCTWGESPPQSGGGKRREEEDGGVRRKMREEKRKRGSKKGVFLCSHSHGDAGTNIGLVGPECPRRSQRDSGRQ
ncbi:hypothetical protein N1851_032052 [Merluccius polli]|uniref:CCHC-type domain-containing protein n=1 Tax=Merluccius polli TaxID=89951 RepID=A0AA47M388_MERPO|nr:hypothetical protein N1851_032052 [Merluccius polli]